MSDSQTQVLQKMQELYKLASEGISKQDFLTSFSNVVSLVTRINKEMIKRQDDSFVAITKQFKDLEKEIKKTASDDFSTLKTDLLSRINKALDDQNNGMKFIYDRVAALEDGNDGEDGHTPTNEELTALITPLIPKIEAQETPEVDIDSIVQQVIAKLPKQETKVGWGAHPLVIAKSGVVKEKVARHINFKGTAVTSVTRNPDGTVDVTLTAGGAGGATQVYEEAVTFIGTEGTLAHTPDSGTLRLYRGGTRQKLNTDYTLSGANITLTSTADAAEVFIADYAFT